jgi:hypothetical protein
MLYVIPLENQNMNTQIPPLATITRNYPNCVEAICHIEVALYAFRKEESVDVWEIMLNADPTLDGMVRQCKELIDVKSSEGGKIEAQHKKAVQQTMNEDFRRYVAGKLGMT